MTKKRAPDPPKKGRSPSALMMRLDRESRAVLTRAAQLRRVSLSDYVRVVMVAQARKDVRAARKQAISLTPDEQLALWNALSKPPRLTDAQRRLGATMRGEQ